MNLNHQILLMLFVSTTLLGFATTGISRWLSRKLDIYDKPSGHKEHGALMPYLGGFGMLLAFLLALFPAVWLAPEVALLRSQLFYTVIGGSIGIFLIGNWDDIRPLSPFVKLGLQALVATAMWVSGIRIENLTIGMYETVSLLSMSDIVGAAPSYIVTVGWYLALMNAMNLVDGLDGLAGGIAALGALSLVGVSIVIGLRGDVFVGAIIAVITAGAATGFLYHNWHPARTFMGDGGSLLLGYLLATASLIGSTKTPTILALVVPMVALGLPLFETGFSFLRRILRKQHPFKPDRRHLHHRLLDLGLTPRRVVIVLHFLTAYLGINSILLAGTRTFLMFLNIAFFGLGLFLLIENMKFLETRRR